MDREHSSSTVFERLDPPNEDLCFTYQSNFAVKRRFGPKESNASTHIKNMITSTKTIQHIESNSQTSTNKCPNAERLNLFDYGLRKYTID